ncbi:MAG: MmgE/PrpD family protein [Actinobacteria bacterium]|nr:MmgE/PrpD family protein [Actinomycetota bacterium]
MASGLTTRLAGMVAAGDRPLSDTWRDLGERAFVDTVGVLLAGRTQPPVTVLADSVVDAQADGPSRSIAVGRRMPARSAALVDGTSAHALDYDDVDDALFGHPSAVLVPTLLALGDACDSSGEALLVAYQRGLETCRALAQAIGIEAHYQAGWHATSTIGTVGAAAAAARLLGLPVEATRHCLGLAATMAGGSRQNFGTMTKPLHAGLAAEHGILAAQLAGGGFTADPDQLEGPMGFLALFGSGAASGATTPFATTTGAAGLNVKLHPCCYATHAAIDATLELVASLAPGAQIITIDVVVPPGGLAPLIHHRPIDGTQAKFSLEYTVAAAIIDGSVTLASFDDTRATKDDIQEALRDVGIAVAGTPPSGPPAWEDPFAAVVTFWMEDGTSVTARVDKPAGHAARPVTEEQLRAKFADCLASVGLHEPGPIYDALRTLRHQAAIRNVLDVVTGA